MLRTWVSFELPTHWFLLLPRCGTGIVYLQFVAGATLELSAPRENGSALPGGGESGRLAGGHDVALARVRRGRPFGGECGVVVLPGQDQPLREADERGRAQ